MTQIQILMGMRNGADYLPVQLVSFAAQNHPGWSLLAGDDGSTDKSVGLVEAFAASVPARQIAVVEGPGQGAAANFFNLIARSEPGSHLAFSDQDDLWLPHKLSRALEQLCAAPGEVAAYGSLTILADARLRPRKLSAWPKRGPSFGNALVQNVMAGNTILLSPAAADLLRASVQAALRAQVPFHDWWIYQVISGSGGRIVIDPEPGLYYRQHESNVMGAHRGIRAGLARTGQVVRRHYSGWIDCNLVALDEIRDMLSPEAAALLDGFVEIRTGPAAARPALLRGMGILRQNDRDDRMLFAMARAGWL